LMYVKRQSERRVFGAGPMKKLLLAIFVLALTVQFSPAVAEKKQPQSCEAKCSKLFATTRQAHKRNQCLHGCRMQKR
jgi:hypothetical protein